MAKVHRVILYLVDANGDYDHLDQDQLGEYVEESLESHLDVTTNVAAMASSAEFEWNDDLKINNRTATIADYEEYLK